MTSTSICPAGMPRRWIAEVKARKNGAGFTQLERWLDTYDLLFLRRNHADPLVVMPWRVWATLLSKKTSMEPVK